MPDYKDSLGLSNLETTPLNRADISTVERLISYARDHHSGSKHAMVACWSKGSNFIYGWNNLYSPARLKASWFPAIAGIHAELDLFLRSEQTNTKIQGGTLYIIGVVTRNHNETLTTLPCGNCQRLLTDGSLNPRKLVVSVDGRLQKYILKETQNDKRSV